MRCFNMVTVFLIEDINQEFYSIGEIIA
ncbi:UDP-3-O-(3-hydroxymyristoyl)glucosamine N-acyltransferase [Burkholderia pseudomallei]|nr:UDP-3-O-(3-hydroxymyristoyl)glucosamine N-acyltransferase [Burkholderia pseudomallei]KVG12796.1 UDP-3-O-(3-hydroxymyristoyl)glucosamine N-acyltransferase [Burkholderia thailandensis]ARK55448.1 UDP-3-O-(3-hydroxymyristoyl)glucosamine N-acyltransferase [Burkholderia pseudomallei]ARK65278.1 UDP-3-O-(3-hydroxymyristoyl)glucosamine N-acyltransferase [Burkholderia pseudomallei]ARK67149.1 UDP-3-O-(3-hydroxymyristoyl)glucosamine N-acyltransferase [Burkholderia pseudomallei]